MSEIQKPKETETIPFYPDHIKTEIRVVWVMLGIAILVGAIAMFFPVGLEEPADPMVTPAHTKPEWYFLALYQILKISKIPGTNITIQPEIWVSLILVALLILLILPFIVKKGDSKKNIRNRLIGSVIFVLVAIALTIQGWFS